MLEKYVAIREFPLHNSHLLPLKKDTVQKSQRKFHFINLWLIMLRSK